MDLPKKMLPSESARTADSFNSKARVKKGFALPKQFPKVIPYSTRNDANREPSFLGTDNK